jgi:hypothetical protein
MYGAGIRLGSWMSQFCCCLDIHLPRLTCPDSSCCYLHLSPAPRCGAPGATRHRRARLFLVAAANDVLLSLAIHVGLLHLPRHLSRAACSLKVPCGMALLYCLLLQVGRRGTVHSCTPLTATMSNPACTTAWVLAASKGLPVNGILLPLFLLQGTLRQWAPIGAVWYLAWVCPQIRLGWSAAHITSFFLTTWLLSCCLAAGLEVWMRLSYLQRKQNTRPSVQQH